MMFFRRLEFHESSHRIRPQRTDRASVESLTDGKRRYAEAVKTMTTVNVTTTKCQDRAKGSGARHGRDDQSFTRNQDTRIGRISGSG